MDTAIRYVIPADQNAPVKWHEVTTRNFTNILTKFTVTVTKSDAETGTAQGNASDVYKRQACTGMVRPESAPYS